jgi:pantetheine-phosphate adenylyltransferase
VALYPGAFDPVHLGHLDIARRAAAMFDTLVVGIYDRPLKQVMFDAQARTEFFRRGLAQVTNVDVRTFSGLTVEFARTAGAQFLIRGLRSAADFEYERQLSAMNRHLAVEIETVYLITSPHLAFLSSSLVKEVAAEGASLDGLVPDYVAEALHAGRGATS